MKTKLPAKISSIKQARKFLTELQKNDEGYHPEDSASDFPNLFTPDEAVILDRLMSEIYALPGNEDVMNMALDPAQVLLDLDENHFPDVKDIDKLQARELLKVYTKEKIKNWIKSEDIDAEVRFKAIFNNLDHGQQLTKPLVKKVFWAIFNEIHS